MGRYSIGWKRRGNGNDYWLPNDEEESECVVVLNEGDQLRLAPPGDDSKKARLRIDFTIDDSRFLCATIHDLQRERDIRTNERVLKLRWDSRTQWHEGTKARRHEGRRDSGTGLAWFFASLIMSLGSWGV